jgi:dsDNA-binding SOS-regulon protein
MNINEITRQYIAAKKTADAANKSLESAEVALKSALNDASITSIEVDGVKVTMVLAERRSFDVDALKELVSNAVFRSVTVPTIKTPLLDAALKLGKISPDVVEQITAVKPYTQMRMK